ncbi:hypothetical protein WJX72_011590 [[Myrmecia] bisecta]|uniref:Uncharacterized protein n=1 Tax=[Myrmecia] bisecta TaxID=41462 RepID=A0AAW1PQ33_9CHLO
MQAAIVNAAAGADNEDMADAEERSARLENKREAGAEAGWSCWQAAIANAMAGADNEGMADAVELSAKTRNKSNQAVAEGLNVLAGCHCKRQGGRRR